MNNKNPHAVELGRLGGQRKTKAKVEAARANGRKGGRPKKSLLQREKEKGACCRYGNCRNWGVYNGYCSNHKNNEKITTKN